MSAKIDIWVWYNKRYGQLVENGDGALADGLGNLLDYAMDGDMAAIDAQFPQLLADIRDRGDKWLELFARHWRLQGAARALIDPSDIIPEAIDLLAFAHTEDVKSCPQRTCVSDDLNALFEVLDGPGYAKERIELANDALTTVPKEQDCFICMTLCKMKALHDSGQPQEALSVWEHASSLSALARDSVYGEEGHHEVWIVLAMTQLACGNPTVALKILDGRFGQTVRQETETSSLRAQALAALGDRASAWEEISYCFDKLAQDVSVRYYAASCQTLLAENIVEASEQLAQQFQDLSAASLRYGRHREAFSAAETAAQIAVRLGDQTRFAAAIEHAEAALPKLHRDMGAKARLVQLLSQ